MKFEPINPENVSALARAPIRAEDLRPKPMRDKRALQRAQGIVDGWGSAVKTSQAQDTQLVR